MPSIGLRGGLVADRNGPTKPLFLGGPSNRPSAPAKSNKLLIALSFWEGDRGQAGTLARFLADLEPAHSSLADFLLVNRFDTPRLVDVEVALSRKFNIFVHTSPKIRTGWPEGCNALFMSAMEWVYKNEIAGHIPRYKAIFNCEADGGPVFVDWIQRMSSAWDAVNAKKPVFLAGPLVTIPAEHINANALLSGDQKFLAWLTAGGPTQALRGGGWDFLLARTFKHMGWANIPGMRSYYATPSFTEAQYQQMRAENLIWVHGDKHQDLITYGRKTLLNEKR